VTSGHLVADLKLALDGDTDLHHLNDARGKLVALRKALDQFGHRDVKIILTSGFGDPEKVKAFVEAEKLLGVRLFDALGVGGIFKPCRMATMDIVAVGETPEMLTPISKVGRPYNPNPRLTQLY
jgi:nicotinate phosphoribosyltransferase